MALDNALAEHRRLGNVHDAGTTLRSIAQLDLNSGRLDEALRASDESAGIFRALHDPNCGARTALVSSEVLHAMGKHALALSHAEDAAAVAARLGFHHNRAAAMWLAGRSHEASGEREAARRAYFEGLRELAQSTSRASLPGLLEASAGLHADAPAAPRLLGVAAALREAWNTPDFPSERADAERWRAAVRLAHDGAVFDRQFAAGRTLRAEDAIAEALTLQSLA
jgi:tetratricopeptide (TPR) repeat protein